MKKIVFYIALLLVSKTVFGQTTQVKPSATQNYVHTIEYKKGVQETALGSLSGDDKLESITYFDGLGRPIQEVKIRQGGKDDTNTDTDLITPFVYDDYGRQDKEFLPFYSSSNKGKYDNSAIANVNAYYINKYGTEISSTNPNPYSQKLYEPSPMNRVLKQAFPGTAWKLGSGHEIKFEFKVNNQSNEVKLYTVTLNSNTAPILSGGSFYGVNQLYKTITLDENHNGSIKDQTIEEFKDKQGKVILKRSYNNNVKHDTYYVYDDFGNLTFVLPPKMDATSENLSTVISRLDELGYQYKYDARHRIIEKKIPGKGWESIVYNALNKPILTQDANLKAQNKWLFTKYDIFGRVAFTGYTVSSASRATLQNNADNTSVQWVSKSVSNSIAETTIFYNNTGYPSMVSEILTINYYDNYSFDRDGLNVPATTSYDTTINGLNLHGLTTGTKVKVLGTNKWITTITGYDEFRRPIWIGTKNDYLSTTNIVESKLKENLDDISGRLQETKTTHLKTGKQNIVIIDTYSYDHSGRVISQTQSINGSSPQAIVENHYDEIGQLDSKEVGGTLQSKLQVVNYKYNIRGWLTNINDIDNFGSEDVFAFKISYNTPTSGTALFNGNISQTEWKTKSINPSPNNLVSTKYTYAYDALNRIVSATDNTGNYNLSSVAYDKNGNIMSLNRKGDINTGATLFGNMDLLSYSYEPNSNKLKKVTDTSGKIQGFKDGANIATEYTYDQNGNMKTDANKGIISIVYNHLNLPSFVEISSGQDDGNITYVYDAVGTKIRKIVIDENTQSSTTTDYTGNFVYENNELQFFNHAEGYVNVGLSELKIFPRPYTFKYVYQYKDHLQNIRLSYSDADGNGTISQSEIIEENNYYPFGLKMRGFNSNVSSLGNSVAQQYKFGGKELSEELNLNTYDFGGRNYNPDLGRWMNIDPLAEKYSPQSPYVYAANNPIRYIDVLGLGPGDPPYIKNNVHFIHFSSPSISIVNRSSSQSFTSAALNSDTSRSNEYTVNLQQYETTSYSAKFNYYRGVIIRREGVRTQGLTIVNGKRQNGGRSSNSYYISQNKKGDWSAGLGDPPSNSKIGFGGGIPLIVNGLAFGEKKKFDSKGNMIQNSSAGFPFQNKKSIGKTILAFDDNGNFMIVSQQNGVDGMTLDGIRDELISKGYTNAISFDGSTSATLVKDKKIIVKPSKRKNNSIPVGAQIYENQ